MEHPPIVGAGRPGEAQRGEKTSRFPGSAFTVTCAAGPERNGLDPPASTGLMSSPTAPTFTSAKPGPDAGQVFEGAEVKEL